ncbi:MAG TPA: polysaccharide pyruvyl transferase family protein [Bellilinea sp.]|nr:polysaccharide pyruvyl transferase family protein [Bellilinea sp.]
MEYNFDNLLNYLHGSKTVYFEPLWGNHGDYLIYLGAMKFFKLNNMTLVGSISDADVVIINGSGGMTSLWGAFPIIERYIEAGAKHIVVLPSSFHVPNECLRRLLTSASFHKCKLMLFARERASLSRLSEVFSPDEEILLCHDMAFFLNEDDIFQEVNFVRANRNFILIVERGDGEVKGIDSAINTKKTALRGIINSIPLKRYAPETIKKSILRIEDRINLSNTKFARKIANEYINRKAKIVTTDISSKRLYSFIEFVETVYSAKDVFTTRLHVSVLRNIFNKTCFLTPTGGEYRKNESIFELSMRHRGYVKLLDM